MTLDASDRKRSYVSEWVELSAAGTVSNCVLIVVLSLRKMLPCRGQFAPSLSYHQPWHSSNPGPPLRCQGEKKKFFLFFLFFPQGNWFTCNFIISSTSYPILVVENSLSPLSLCGLRSLSISTIPIARVAEIAA